jgi:hypothetical protein
VPHKTTTDTAHLHSFQLSELSKLRQNKPVVGATHALRSACMTCEHEQTQPAAAANDQTTKQNKETCTTAHPQA